jgi:hypothetical protein
MTTRVGERSATQKATKTEAAPPPQPQPSSNDDAVGIDELASAKKQDAFGGPRLARGDFSAGRSAASAKSNEGPDLLLDDGPATGGFVDSDGQVGTMGHVPPPRTPQSTFATTADAIAAIERDYGVKVNGTFSLEELSRVHESLALVPAKDRAALRGVALEREATAPPTHQQARSDGGTIAALFFDGSEPESAEQRYPHITFYDAAFPSTTHTGDDRRLSQSVVLHEAAHAIDGGAAGVHRLAFFHAQEARKKSDAVAKPIAADVVDLASSYRDAASDEPKSAALSTAIGRWEQAMTTLRTTSDPATKKRAEAELSSATRSRDAAFAALPDGEAKDAAQKLIAAQDALVAPERESAQHRIAEEAALKLLRKLVADPPAASAQQTIAADTNAVASFHKQAPTPISGYGATHPEENFAEAYALFRRDPAALRDLSKPAYDYMMKHHR